MIPGVVSIAKPKNSGGPSGPAPDYEPSDIYQFNGTTEYIPPEDPDGIILQFE